MNYTIDELRQLLAEEEAEEAAKEKDIKQANKNAGLAHTKVVLALYDRLAIGAEHPTTRTKNGNVIEVAVDRKEEQRTQRLLAALMPIIDATNPATLGEIKSKDTTARAQSKAQRDKARQSRASRPMQRQSSRPSVPGGAVSAPASPVGIRPGNS